MGFLKEKLMDIYFIGIGGYGMSGLARLLFSEGHTISGSDTREIQDLAQEGIQVYLGHDGSRIQGQDLVVYSSAIPSTNPEICQAKTKNIPLAHRSEILAELMSKKKAIAITGMHGKTSTTGLVAKILMEAGLDPLSAVGGDFSFLESNVRSGAGSWAVFEADESDGSLLRYQPEIAVITNLESEHVDFFHNFDQILSHFLKFISSVKGTVILNADDPGCQSLMKLCPRESIKSFLTYGFSEEAQIRGVNVQLRGWESHFEIFGKSYAFRLPVPGLHQASNALAAIAVAGLLGIDSSIIRRALENFSGAKRRFDQRGQFNGVTFLDDYAHHPSEIRATLQAARGCFGGKILGIFQPHRYSRTSYFKEEFARSLATLDYVVITDIYPGGENPIPGVTGRLIYDELQKLGKSSVEYVPSLDALKSYLLQNYSKYEVILTLGAGDITNLSKIILEEGSRDFLGRIRGKLLKDESMTRHTTFRLGGPADWWIEPVDLEDLLEVQTLARVNALPIFIIGNGSNVIVKDGGIRGIVIRLSSDYFRRFKVEGESLAVGAGLSMAEIIKIALDAGLGGLENLKGIPGTIGGALHFNAGAYGSEIGDRVESIMALNPDGSLETMARPKIGFQYRNAMGLKGKIVLEARFKLAFSNLRQMQEKVVKLKNERAIRYPKLPNAGCIFRNPDKNFAGKLIDEAGLKNLSVGKAQVSREHANFIVNTGQAKASDVLELIERVRKRVQESKNIHLENEVEVIGED